MFADDDAGTDDEEEEAEDDEELQTSYEQGDGLQSDDRAMNVNCVRSQGEGGAASGLVVGPLVAFPQDVTVPGYSSAGSPTVMSRFSQDSPSSASAMLTQMLMPLSAALCLLSVGAHYR